MAMKCENCGKKIQRGNFVSHAKNRVKRVFKPNLKKVAVMVDGRKRKMILCAKCVKRVKKKSYL